MKAKNDTSAFSGQENGTAVYAETVTESDNLIAAHEIFLRAKARLLDVNGWQKLTGDMFASFQLTGPNGEPVQGLVREGNLFQIDIPGPGTKDGHGFDWVSVERIDEFAEGDTESLSITVRPASNPLSDSDAIAHFYAASATSTFSITRHGTKVTASVLDENVKPNKQAETGVDQIRNAVVGTVGMLLFSKIQWETLTEGLLSAE